MNAFSKATNGAGASLTPISRRCAAACLRRVRLREADPPRRPAEIPDEQWDEVIMYLDTNEATELTFKGFVGLYTLQTGACSSLSSPFAGPPDATPSSLPARRERRGRDGQGPQAVGVRPGDAGRRRRRDEAGGGRRGQGVMARRRRRRYPGWLDTSAMHSDCRLRSVRRRKCEREARLCFTPDPRRRRGGGTRARASTLNPSASPTQAEMATRQRSAGVRRLLQEAQELEQDDCADYAAQPLEVRRSLTSPPPERAWKLTQDRTLAGRHVPVALHAARCRGERLPRCAGGSRLRRHARLSLSIERVCQDAY